MLLVPLLFGYKICLAPIFNKFICSPLAVSSVTIRPQNSSPYKKVPAGAIPQPGMLTNTLTNRLQQCGPHIAHSNDEIQRLAPSLSAEELNQEMANLEGLMKDLSAITANEFEC